MVSQIAMTCERKFSLWFHKSTSAATTIPTANAIPANAASEAAETPSTVEANETITDSPPSKAIENPSTVSVAVEKIPKNSPIVLIAETTFPTHAISEPRANITGPTVPMIKAVHLTQPSTGRLSQIVPRTRTTLSLNVMMVCFMFSMSCLILASLLPRPATKFSAAAFMELNEPDTVVLASLAVVPVTPNLS